MDSTALHLRKPSRQTTAGLLAAVGTLWRLMQIVGPNYWTSFSDMIALLLCIGGTYMLLRKVPTDPKRPWREFLPLLLVYTGGNLLWFTDFLYYLFHGWTIHYMPLVLLLGIFGLLGFCAVGRISPKAAAIAVGLFPCYEFLQACLQEVANGYATVSALFIERLPGFVLTTAVVAGLLAKTHPLADPTESS